MIAVPSIAAAAAAVGPHDRIMGAVLGVPFEQIRDSDFVRGLEERGTWIVCLNDGSSAEIRERGWIPLARPIFSDDFTRLVRPLTEGWATAG